MSDGINPIEEDSRHSEEFWYKHNKRKAWFDSRTPKELEEIEHWMIERHEAKRQLAKREDDYREIRERSDEQIEGLQRQLAEAREENKKLKSGVFVIMRSGANADFPVSFKHTKEEAEAEALKLDKQQKYFPHYVEQLKENRNE